MLQPLLSALIFAVVFGFIAKMPSQGVPYFLIAFSGMMGWTLFFGNLTRVSPSLVANAALVRKIYFPRLLVPLGVVPSVMLDFLVSVVVMVVLMVIYRAYAGMGIAAFSFCVLIILVPVAGSGPDGQQPLPSNIATFSTSCPSSRSFLMWCEPGRLFDRRGSASHPVLLSAQSAGGTDRYDPLGLSGPRTTRFPISCLFLRRFGRGAVGGFGRL